MCVSINADIEMWFFIVLLLCASFKVKADGRENKLIEIKLTKMASQGYSCRAIDIPKLYKNDSVQMKIISPVALKYLKCGYKLLDSPGKWNYYNRILNNNSKTKTYKDNNFIYDYNLDLLNIYDNTTICFFAHDECSCNNKNDHCDIDNFKYNCGTECQVNLTYTDPDMSMIKVNGKEVPMSVKKGKDYDAIGTYFYHDGENINIHCTNKGNLKNPIKYNYTSNFDLTRYQTNEIYGLVFKDLNITLFANHSGKYIDCIGLHYKYVYSSNIRLTLKMDPKTGLSSNNDWSTNGNSKETNTQLGVANSSSEPGPFENPKDYRYWIIGACVAPIFIIIIGIIICVCRRKNTNNKPNLTTPILTQTSQNEYVEPGVTPATNTTLEYDYARPSEYSQSTTQEYDYARPSDYSQNTYSLPYSPRTVQELYSTPIPKNQRLENQANTLIEPKPLERRVKGNFGVSSTDILRARHNLGGKNESPYAEISNESKRPYSEVTNISESPYAEISNASESQYSDVSIISESPYAEVSNKINKKTLPKKENPYAKISYVSKDPHGYYNVFDKSKYVNTDSSKLDYAEPAYCDMAGND